MQLRRLSDEQQRFAAFRRELASLLSRPAPAWIGSPGTGPCYTTGAGTTPRDEVADSEADLADPSDLIRWIEAEIKEKYEIVNDLVLCNGMEHSTEVVAAVGGTPAAETAAAAPAPRVLQQKLTVSTLQLAAATSCAAAPPSGAGADADHHEAAGSRTGGGCAASDTASAAGSVDCSSAAAGSVKVRADEHNAWQPSHGWGRAKLHFGFHFP